MNITRADAAQPLCTPVSTPTEEGQLTAILPLLESTPVGFRGCLTPVGVNSSWVSGSECHHVQSTPKGECRGCAMQLSIRKDGDQTGQWRW
jgi:hypothetical protein